MPNSLMASAKPLTWTAAKSIARAYLGLLLLWSAMAAAQTIEAGGARRPATPERDLYWLSVMKAHGYSRDEMLAAGLSPEFLASPKPAQSLVDRNGSIRLLPYPGGRHPRLGFRDGAIAPRRETKFSVFAPWDPDCYVVVDLPEAIFSNLGLTYLAHTHVSTLWTKAGIDLAPMEWAVSAQGALSLRRTLPNGVSYAARAWPRRAGVAMELSITNGTTSPLTEMRAQVCAMLGRAKGFDSQSNENKVFRAPYASCRDREGRRWIILAFEPCQRAWGNPPCPCLHADPRIPDAPVGQTRTARGGLWFHDGADLDQAIREIEKANREFWRQVDRP